MLREKPAAFLLILIGVGLIFGKTARAEFFPQVFILLAHVFIGWLFYVFLRRREFSVAAALAGAGFFLFFPTQADVLSRVLRGPFPAAGALLYLPLAAAAWFFARLAAPRVRIPDSVLLPQYFLRFFACACLIIMAAAQASRRIQP